jgi:hypothetical protein
MKFSWFKPKKESITVKNEEINEQNYELRIYFTDLEDDKSGAVFRESSLNFKGTQECLQEMLNNIYSTLKDANKDDDVYLANNLIIKKRSFKRAFITRIE